MFQGLHSVLHDVERIRLQGLSELTANQQEEDRGQNVKTHLHWTHTHSHSGKLTRKNGMRKIKVADEPHAAICYCDAEPGLLLAGLRPRAASASWSTDLPLKQKRPLILLWHLHFIYLYFLLRQRLSSVWRLEGSAVHATVVVHLLPRQSCTSRNKRVFGGSNDPKMSILTDIC